MLQACGRELVHGGPAKQINSTAQSASLPTSLALPLKMSPEQLNYKATSVEPAHERGPGLSAFGTSPVCRHVRDQVR